MSKFKDEIDFLDIIRDPIRLFGHSYFYFLAAIIAIGIIYVQHITDIGKNAIKPRPVDTLAMAEDLPFVTASTSAAVDLSVIAKPTEKLLARGRELYTINCQSCHGEKGFGNGPAGTVLNPRPRNFTQKDGWTNGRTYSGMFKTVTEGILARGMASYNHLLPMDRIAIIHHVRSLAADFPPIASDEAKQLDVTFKLSESSRVSPQIPVALAMRKLEQESSNEIAKQRAMASKQLSADEATALFTRLCADRARASAYFVATNVELQTLDSFIRSVTAAPRSYGFKPTVATLTRDQWASIYSVAVTLFKTGKS